MEISSVNFIHLSDLTRSSCEKLYIVLLASEKVSIRVLPDGFLLKAIVLTVCEHEYMNIHSTPPPPPPPIITSSYGPAGPCATK